MTSHFDPGQSILTRFFEGADSTEMVCQLRISAQDRIAYISFISGKDHYEGPDLAFLMNDLGHCTQDLGAMHMVAEIEHKHPLLEDLKSLGFVVSAWQDIWKLNQQATNPEILERVAEWCPLPEVDWWQAKQLLQSIIPPISQITDLPQRHLTRFWVCHNEENIIAVADVRYGPQGIWIQPTFTPEVTHVPDLICNLSKSLPARLTRPIFLSVRSYQSWLFRSIEMMNVEYIGHQAILVKHLVGLIKELTPIESFQLHKAKPKPSHSVLPSHPIS